MVMEIIISVFLLFVGIAILVLIHVCIVGRAFRREFDIDGVPIIKGAGMPLNDLKKLPCFVYKQDDDSEKDSEKDSSSSSATDDNNSTDSGTTTATDSAAIIDCAVCLDCFENGDECRMLPNCHHYFHSHCVDAWLSKSPFCPICRTCTIVVTSTKPSPKVAASGEVGETPTNATSPEEMC